MTDFEFEVPENLNGERADTIIVSLYPELSRSSLKHRLLFLNVNNKLKKPSAKLRAGEHVRFQLKETQSLSLEPEDIPFEILYRDNDIAVINKPAGLAVHPSHGHSSGTLVNGLLYKLGDSLSGIGGVERPGIVHRLDMDTAGLMLIALNDKSHRVLSEAFKERKIHKIYHAIVKGTPPAESEINAPIGRSERDRKKMAVREDGKNARTVFRVLEYFDRVSYIEVQLFTGRTHQIRVHLSHIGYPILGDPIYSRGKQGGLMLCAKEIGFSHPTNGREMYFIAELPQHFQQALEALRIKNSKQ